MLFIHINVSGLQSFIYFSEMFEVAQKHLSWISTTHFLRQRHNNNRC